MEGTTVLRGVAAVFHEAHLDLVTRQHGRLVWSFATRDHLESEHGFVKRQGGGKIPHRKIHVVALVTKDLLERCLHRDFSWLSQSLPINIDDACNVRRCRQSKLPGAQLPMSAK